MGVSKQNIKEYIENWPLKASDPRKVTVKFRFCCMYFVA